VAKQKDL